jgi:hypothetical protein
MNELTPISTTARQNAKKSTTVWQWGREPGTNGALSGELPWQIM